MSRQNRWFQPKDGISREVIQADIQRYLGRDATVRPGVENGVDGYWITAYRTLTTEMVKDLQLDSRRWAQELSQGRGSPHGSDSSYTKKPNKSLERYTDSATHQSRQYYGPSDSTPAPEASTAAYASPNGYSTQQYAAQPASAYPDDRNRQRAPAAQAYQSSPQQTQNYTYSTQPQAYAPQPAYAQQTYAQTPSSQYYQQPGYGQAGYAPAAANTEPRTTPSSGYYQAAGQADPYAASRYPAAQQQAPAGYQYAQSPATTSTRETVYTPTPASSSQAYYSSSHAGYTDPRQRR